MSPRDSLLDLVDELDRILAAFTESVDDWEDIARALDCKMANARLVAAQMRVLVERSSVNERAGAALAGWFEGDKDG